MALKASQLRHAVELARHGNFHQAAEQLQISQAGLSRSIQSLESNLGTKLFDRLGSGTAPTTLGRLVVERGAEIIEALDDLEREVRLTLGLEVGSLAIGAGPYPMVLSVMPALGRLLAERPNLRVRAKQHDWLSVTDAVTHHDVDLAVAEVSHAKELDHLDTSLIGQHQLYFFARPDHPLLKDTPPSFDDIVRFPNIGTPVPERVAGHFRSGSLGTTFGGGPVAAAAIVAVIDAIQKDDLLANVRAREIQVRAGCQIGPVEKIQGMGLMLGLVCDRPAADVRDALLEHDILTGTSGDPHVLRILAPLVLEADQVDRLETALASIPPARL